MNPADTIIDARLINDDTALVVSTGSESYKYMLVDLQAKTQQPYEITLFMENEPYYEQAEPAKNPASEVAVINTDDDYYSMLDMHYSGTVLGLGNDSTAGVIYNLSINFADTLSMNSFSLFANRGTDEYGLAGVSYDNNQYFLNYKLTAYSVYDRPDLTPATPASTDKRDYGLIINASIPFLRTGYYYGNVGASYFEDYNSDSRKPLGLNLTLGNSKRFGVSMNTNFEVQATAYGMEDRGDNAYGGKGIYQQGLPGEVFLNVSGQYSSSDTNTGVDERGIKIARTKAFILEDSDLSTIIMPGIKLNPDYAKEVTKVGFEVSKVFNFQAYYFKFPISLRREAFFASYNRYEITDFGSNKNGVNETSVGVDLDTVWLNLLAIPIRMQYIYTDDSNIANQEIFQISSGFEF